jgi:undecaprenyl diphosphate synthase
MIDKNNIPQHIAIIMDGYGRWAKERGQVRTAGHVEGVAALQRITADCCRLGVKYLTLYAFSTENWNRPDDEVAALMGLVLTHLTEELFDKNHVRMRVIGDRSRLPQAVREKLEWIENRTASYDVMTVTLAISYSSRWEITDAVKQIAEEVKEGKIAPDAITEETVIQHLNPSFQPDPDLLIRTGGELRISNYLLWQIAYSELYFTPVYWPDFNNDELLKAVEYYQTKQRRFGKTGEQVEEEESK